MINLEDDLEHERLMNRVPEFDESDTKYDRMNMIANAKHWCDAQEVGVYEGYEVWEFFGSVYDVSDYEDRIHYALVKGDVETEDDVKYVAYGDKIHDDLEVISKEYWRERNGDEDEDEEEEWDEDWEDDEELTGSEDLLGDEDEELWVDEEAQDDGEDEPVL